MLVETQQLLEFKVVLFLAQEPIPRPRSIPLSSARPRLPPMVLVEPKAKERILWMACLQSLHSLDPPFLKSAAVVGLFLGPSTLSQPTELDHTVVSASEQSADHP